MFIGHFGVGFGVKKASPFLSLGLLFLAAQFLDLLWPTLLLMNVEHVIISADGSQTIPLRFSDYPISHSLLMATVWAVLFGSTYWIFKRNRRNAVILGLCVLSHWFLDLLVHYPDLPLVPGSSVKLGMQLWNNLVIENMIEGLLLIAGVLWYMQATKPKNRKGVFLLWILVGLLVVSHIANIFSPPPPNVTAVALGTQAMWLFVILAFWLDKNRTPVSKDRINRIKKQEPKLQTA